MHMHVGEQHSPSQHSVGEDPVPTTHSCVANITRLRISEYLVTRAYGRSCFRLNSCVSCASQGSSWEPPRTRRYRLSASCKIRVRDGRPVTVQSSWDATTRRGAQRRRRPALDAGADIRCSCRVRVHTACCLLCCRPCYRARGLVGEKS